MPPEHVAPDRVQLGSRCAGLRGGQHRVSRLGHHGTDPTQRDDVIIVLGGHHSSVSHLGSLGSYGRRTICWEVNLSKPTDS
jgi:hypothetical protein